MRIMASKNYEVGIEDASSCDLPELGLPVCACCSVDDVWKRGRVVAAGLVPKTYSVFYVDNGSKEDLPIQRIKLLEKCFADLPALTIECSLPVLLESDINRDHPPSLEPWQLNWPRSCIHHFVDLVGEDKQFSLEVLSVGGDGLEYVVRLFNDECNIREVLVAKLHDSKEHVITVESKASDTEEGDSLFCKWRVWPGDVRGIVQYEHGV
jgi:hypothetical protein